MLNRMVPRLPLLIAALGLVTSVVLAPSPALRAQAPGEPVSLDFVALGSDGRPVLDLSAAQVTLKVDGKERKIQALRLVKSGDGPAAGPAPSTDPAPAPFATNTGTGSDDGRSILIVVDEDSLRPGIERPVRDALTQLIASLAPSDRIGLVTVPRGTVHVDPSTAHGRVRDALATVSGRMTATSDNSQRPCRARDTLDALRGVLGGLGGSPTIVLMFSSEMVGPSGGGGSSGNNACELQTNDFQKVGVAASEARAQFYIVQPDTAATSNLEGLQNLAGVTGGQYQRLATDANPLARIALETSARYVATFVPEPSERNGQSHRVELKVAREGVSVRTRAETTIARSGAARATAAAKPREMVATTAAYRDLPLRATALSSRGIGGKLQILVMAETTDPTAKLNAATVALIDSTTNKLVAQGTADEKQVAASPVMMSLLADAGSYRLRFAATDASGRAGAVDLPLSAALASAGPLKFSTLVLGTAGPSGFAPAMQFTGPGPVMAYVELYGSMAGAQLGAKLEIASTPTGPAISTVQPSGRGTSEPDKFLLTADLPIADLAPGDYVVRLIIGVQGQPETTLTRTLRKVK